MKTNCCLCCFPVQLVVLLWGLQLGVNKAFSILNKGCGCKCVDTGDGGPCQQKCGIEYSDPLQAINCPIPHPPDWPPLLQVPAQDFRAVRTDVTSHGDLPDDSCKKSGACPVTLLLTGEDQKFGQGVSENFFAPPPKKIDKNDVSHVIAGITLATAKEAPRSNYLDEAFSSADDPLFLLQPSCQSNNS